MRRSRRKCDDEGDVRAKDITERKQIKDIRS